jgi:hypothetical protein
VNDQYVHGHIGKRAGIEPVPLSRQVVAVLGLRFQLQAKQRKTNCCHGEWRPARTLISTTYTSFAVRRSMELQIAAATCWKPLLLNACVSMPRLGRTSGHAASSGDVHMDLDPQGWYPKRPRRVRRLLHRPKYVPPFARSFPMPRTCVSAAPHTLPLLRAHKHSMCPPDFCNKTLYSGLLANATSTYVTNHWEPHTCGQNNGVNGPVAVNEIYSQVCFIGPDYQCQYWNVTNCNGMSYPDW